MQQVIISMYIPTWNIVRFPSAFAMTLIPRKQMVCTCISILSTEKKNHTMKNIFLKFAL